LEGDWEKLVKAAREEGRLTVYGTTVFGRFQVFSSLSRDPSPSSSARREIAPRLMQERRAGKYRRYFTGGMLAYELFIATRR
jgi:hypothetical protein